MAGRFQRHALASTPQPATRVDDNVRASSHNKSSAGKHHTKTQVTVLDTASMKRQQLVEQKATDEERRSRRAAAKKKRNQTQKVSAPDSEDIRARDSHPQDKDSEDTEPSLGARLHRRSPVPTDMGNTAFSDEEANILAEDPDAADDDEGEDQAHDDRNTDKDGDGDRDADDIRAHSSSIKMTLVRSTVLSNGQKNAKSGRLLSSPPPSSPAARPILRPITNTERASRREKKRKRSKTNTGKHKNSSDIDAGNSSDSDDDASDSADDSAAKPKKKAKKPRAKAGDFKDEDAHKVLLRAINLFQLLVCLDDGFPDADKAHLWALEVWETANRDYRYNCLITKKLEKLITDRESTIRSRIREKVVLLIRDWYGFKKGRDDESIQFNKELAATLLKDDNFTFKKWEDESGPFGHPILQEIIDQQFFFDKTALGVQYAQEFNPVPKPLIALIFTIVRYGLQLWADGYKKKAPTMHGHLLVDTYEGILASIEEWCRFSDDAAHHFARYQIELFQNAWEASGAAEDSNEPTAPKTPRISVSKFARAAAALRREESQD